MKRSFSWFVWLWTAVYALGIEDIPEGGFLWLQGYDLNPSTPGFRVDGQLRLESTDEPQAVGVLLSSGRLTNSTTGTIFVNHGPGGTRFVYGDLLNEGLLKLNALLFFSKDGSELIQRAVLDAGPFTGLAMTGRGSIFRQQAGEIRYADYTSRFEFYNQSIFQYEGGTVQGEPVIVASTARIPQTVEDSLRIRFGGIGCVYDGPIPSNVTLHVYGDSRFGAVSLALTNVVKWDGPIDLWASPGLGNPGATLQMPADGLTCSETAVLNLIAGSDPVLLQGKWENRGHLIAQSLLQLRNTSGVWTNRGSIQVPAGGGLDCGPILVQVAGDASISPGGAVATVRGYALQGGTLRLNGSLYGVATNQAMAFVDQAQPGQVIGNWYQDPAGTLQITMRALGTNVGPALQVRGTLQLGGTLKVTLAEGLVLGDGSVLNLARGDLVQGWFDRLDLPPLPNGLYWEVLPSPTQVQLAVRSEQPAVQVQLSRGDDGDTLQLTGPIIAGAEATIRVSFDLTTWKTLGTFRPFNGVIVFPVPPLEGQTLDGATFFGATLTSPAPSRSGNGPKGLARVLKPN